MAELTELQDAETREAIAVAAGAPIDQGAAARPASSSAGAGSRSGWPSRWLFFIVFSAVGANWLPYVKHSCSQYANASWSAAPTSRARPLKIERPPVWAVWAEPERSLPGAPGAGRLVRHRPQRLRRLQPGHLRRPRVAA